MRHRTVTAITAHLALLAALSVVAPGAGAATLPLSGTLDLAEAEPASAARWTGSEVNGLAGSSVAGIGDFNGDGRRDLAVGEPKRDTAAGKDSGAVHIVLDPARGGRLDDPAVVLAIRGAAAGDLTGFNVAAAGDVNGDGLADVVVGAPNAGGNPPERADRGGAAYVVFGRADRAPIDLAAPGFGGLRLGGVEPGSQLGRAVGAIGDLNGDGLGEVLISAPARDLAGRPDAGSAYVVFGRRAGGDVNLGALVDSGGGYRLDGPVGSSAGGAQAGRALASIGDLNGDGRPELLITAPRAGTGLASGARAKGTAYVVWGRSSAGVIDLEALGADGYAITGRSTTPGPDTRAGAQGDVLGESIASPGDVNGDGRPDVVVGAHLGDATDRADAGLAYVVFGKADARAVNLDELGEGGYRITGVDQQDQTGFDVAPAGDFNGDGLADMVVSSLFGEPFSRPNAGAVFVVWGRRGAPSDLDLAEIGDRALRVGGAQAGDTLGFSVDTLGDVNGDGGADLVVGATAIDAAYLFTGASEKPGTAYVVFGATGVKPGAEILTDPGYQEEKRRGCTIATNVQVLMEDNAYTDQDADPRRIRLAGMQSYVATPRNRGTVLGVTGFASGGEDDGVAEPIIEPTVLGPTESSRLNQALLEGVDGEDPFPGYPFMARTFANDNPGAQARILLVDGVLFRDMDDYSGLTEGNPPTYVIAVGNPPDRNRRDIREMRRLANDTDGRYDEARTPRAIERALQNIESRLRCDLEADNYVAELNPGETEELAETDLDDNAHTADVRLTWRDPRAGFEVQRIDVVRDGNVVRRIGAAAIRRAYRTRGAGAAVSGGRGRTFRALHLRGLQAGGTLRVIVRPQRGRRTGRVYGRVTQSRRRR